jgi:hypothetical protein
MDHSNVLYLLAKGVSGDLPYYHFFLVVLLLQLCHGWLIGQVSDEQFQVSVLAVGCVRSFGLVFSDVVVEPDIPSDLLESFSPIAEPDIFGP